MYVWIFSLVSGVVAYGASGLVDICTSYIWAGVLLSGLLIRWQYTRWLAFFVLGFLYAEWRADLVLADQLPLALSNKLFQIQATALPGQHSSKAGELGEVYSFGEVVVFDYAGRRISRGEINLEKGNQEKGNQEKGNQEKGNQEKVNLRKLNIRTYGALRPEAYQRCSFYARLKTPIGKRNPGGRNAELAYFQRGISAIGYVLDHPRNRCWPQRKRFSLSDLRANLVRAFDETKLTAGSGAVFKALALAEREDLTQQQWDVLRQTGTSHLLAISGLHITLVAALVFAAVRQLLFALTSGRHSALVIKGALVASLLSAFFYAALANFALPAQRAVVMVCVSVIALLYQRLVLSYRTLLLAALAVLLLDPKSLLSVGFWLSFGAVGILVLMRSIRSNDGWLSTSIRTHCFLSIGLLPIAGFISDTVPLSAPLANLFAVPIFSLLVVPLVLIGTLCAGVGLNVYSYFWQLAAIVYEQVWRLLKTFAAWDPQLSMSFAPTGPQLALAAMGIAVMLIPLFPRRWIFVFACLFQLMFTPKAAFKTGEFRVVVLDVGQGLSVVVQTAEHVLVYDTGPSYRGYSAGKQVVVPALKALGLKTIDQLVISHGDNDHAGGYEQLRHSVTIDSVLVPIEPEKVKGARVCQRGLSWGWDGVRFEMLSPLPESLGSANNLSCVMRVHSAAGSVLLPGDIEELTERELLGTYGEALASDILIAPHHGSDTSSIASFVETVRPIYVVYAAGFHNRFNFPNKQVYDRYRANGAEGLITSELGAIEFLVRQNNIFVNSEREKPLVWRFP